MPVSWQRGQANCGSSRLACSPRPAVLWPAPARRLPAWRRRPPYPCRARRPASAPARPARGLPLRRPAPGAPQKRPRACAGRRSRRAGAARQCGAGLREQFILGAHAHSSGSSSNTAFQSAWNRSFWLWPRGVSPRWTGMVLPRQLSLPRTASTVSSPAAPGAQDAVHIPHGAVGLGVQQRFLDHGRRQNPFLVPARDRRALPAGQLVRPGAKQRPPSAPSAAPAAPPASGSARRPRRSPPRLHASAAVRGTRRRRVGRFWRAASAQQVRITSGCHPSFRYSPTSRSISLRPQRAAQRGLCLLAQHRHIRVVERRQVDFGGGGLRRGGGRRCPFPAARPRPVLQRAFGGLDAFQPRSLGDRARLGRARRPKDTAPRARRRLRPRGRWANTTCCTATVSPVLRSQSVAHRIPPPNPAILCTLR